MHHHFESKVEKRLLLTEFFQGGGGICPPPLDMLRILFYMYINYKNFNDTINGKLCLCKNSHRFHQIVSNKRKYPGGACPQPP